MGIMREKTGTRWGTAALATLALAGGAMGVSAQHAQAATTSALSCGQDATYPNRYNCTVSGTSDQATVVLPIHNSAGIALQNPGTTAMRSGAGSITITPDAMTFAFSKAYLATHSAPFQFSGGVSFSVDNQHVAGPFTINVGGQSYVTSGPGGYCGTKCDEIQKGTSKVAWDGTDGRAIWVMLRGADVVKVGQRIDFVDHAGKGQSHCQAEIDQQRTDGTWVRVGTATTDAAGTTVTASYTPKVAGAVHVFGSCVTDGTQSVYTDQGTIAGVPVSAQTKVTDLGGNGTGHTKPVPTVTQTYQVDVATLGSNAVVNRYARADDDGALTYRELATLWQKAGYARHFSEKHEYVTITIPANATTAQRIAAINARTTLGDVSTTAKMATGTAKSAHVVVAWLLDTAHGARPADGGLAWGPKHNLAQTYFARS